MHNRSSPDPKSHTRNSSHTKQLGSLVVARTRRTESFPAMFSCRPTLRAAARAAVVTVTTAVVAATFSAPAQAAGYGVDGVAPDAETGEAAAPAEPVSAPDVEVESTTVPAVDPATAPETPGPAEVVAELPKKSTGDFRMVGVTWSPDSDLEGVSVELRTRTAGEWTDWQTLDAEPSDDGSGVPGTEPLWVGDADGVEARVLATSGTPRGVKVDTIDPGTDDVAATGTASAAPASTRTVSNGVARASTVATTGSAVLNAPKIIRRAQWGAAKADYCSAPQVGATTRGVVLHHSAGSNSYTKSQSASLVRGIQAYHIQSRGWCDIGYNFLVDKYGQIFEGRAGGMDRNVRAAHSGNGPVNEEAMGVTMMGNYDTVQVPEALRHAVVKLIGWRMATFYLPAKGTYSLGGKRLNYIAGHRDVVSTACPGRYGYAWISASGGLRDRVAKYIATANPVIEKKYEANKAVTGLPYIGETTVVSGVRQTRFAKADIYARTASQTSAKIVRGSFRTKLNAVGGVTAGLGVPTQDSPTVGSAVTKQAFNHGAMYAVPGRGYFAVYGPTYTLYRQFGFSSGELGAPTSSVGAVSNGRTKTTFANGHVLANVKTGNTQAYGKDGKEIRPSGSATPTTPAAMKAPAKPTGTSTTTSITSSWPAVSGAKGYEACLMAAGSTSKCGRLTKVTGTKVTWENLQTTSYVVKVRAVDGSRRSSWSPSSSITRKLAAPPAPTGSASTSITYSWAAVPGAKGYEACLMAAGSTSKCGRLTKVTGTKVTWENLKTTRYVVKVRAVNGSTVSSWSPSSTITLPSSTPTTPKAPAKPTATSTTKSITYTWPAVSGATGYEACLMAAGSTSKCGRLTKVTGAKVTWDKLATTSYVAKIRAVNGSKVSSWSPSSSITLKSTSSSLTVPSSRNIVIQGHGYGHGIGMSQYGAQGAARQGVKAPAILARYYPGTKLSKTSGSMRVLISAHTSSTMEVLAASGLRVHDSGTGKTATLPTTAGGKKITRWRITPSGTKGLLQYRTTGSWVNRQTISGYGQLGGPTTLTLVLPSGTLKVRGSLRSIRPSSSSTRDTVNVVSVDDYVKGVVAAEMPASWSPEALKAQAVAARTYGVRSRVPSRYYDICTTTACQVYSGVSGEDSRTNAAVSATSNQILTYQGSPAFTQFSSSSGGYTSVGSQPYLKAVEDPWDGWSGNANHAWKITVKASTIERSYSSIGTLRKLTVTKRTGGGSLGGRVVSLRLEGSKKSITISGDDARWAFGLKSNWFGF